MTNMHSMFHVRLRTTPPLPPVNIFGFWLAFVWQATPLSTCNKYHIHASLRSNVFVSHDYNSWGDWCPDSCAAEGQSCPSYASFSSTLALKGAKNEWLQDSTAAETRYGHITYWDVFDVTNMDQLFQVCSSTCLCTMFVTMHLLNATQESSSCFPTASTSFGRTHTLLTSHLLGTSRA